MFKMVNGDLKIYQEDIPKLNVNIMSDMQNSYRKYLYETVYEDMKYLEELLRGYQGMSNMELKVYVGDLVQQNFTKTQTNLGKCYYPVYGDIYLDGQKVGKEMQLLRIPYMDDYCHLNVDGKSKIVKNSLRSSDDISYVLKNDVCNISMPYANVKIENSKKTIVIRHAGKKLYLDQVISAMLGELKDNTSLYSIFANSAILNKMTVRSKTLNTTCLQALKRESNILEKLKSTQYKLGDTRESLNEVLTLDRAIGQTLSRDIAGYREGELITRAMVQDFKKARVSTVYVRSTKVPTGYTLSSISPLIFSEIPKGTKNCKLLRTRFPEYASLDTIPEDIVLDKNSVIVISNSTPLTETEAEFLAICGFTTIDVRVGKSSKIFTYSFEREICSNYTAKLGELVDVIPEGRSADEYVYYYNNPNLERREELNWLTPHDLIAIMSLMGEIIITEVSPILNRDTSFLKKVMLVGDIFSTTLRKTMSDYVKSRVTTIIPELTKAFGNNPFWKLTDKWISKMNEEKYLSIVDSTNLIAEVSQVNYVETIVQNSSSVADEMRHLAIPYYGRLCQFETPAGKKLGLVNTKAIGAKIIDGIIYTPYRKVIQTANGIRISDKITWLSVKQELGYKFGDTLSLKKDPKDPTKYLNVPILARVPNPEISDDPFVFATIDTYDLAGGYVEAYPEQFLSPSAAMVPFVCSNNAVRISYGISQLRQSIYLPNSNTPTVRTEMYEDIFNYSTTVEYTSPCDGEVISINNLRAVIEDANGKEWDVLIQKDKHHGQLDAVVELMTKPGSKVKKGDLLAVANKYPQPFVVRAPYDCTIYKINDEGIFIVRDYKNLDFIDLTNADFIAINNGRILGNSAVFLNIHCYVGQKVKKGEILADTCMSRGGVYTPARNPLVAYIATAYNYEDGVHSYEKGSINYTSMTTGKIDTSVSKKYHSSPRAESLYGFKYYEQGETVARIKLKESSNSENKLYKNVKATFHANGIPYEVKTIEDNKNERIYRHHLLAFNKLSKGDKMAGGHGNKGVVTIVEPDSRSYQLKNGKTIEFALNPCGVPSRMNLGQIWHAHLGLIATVLNTNIISNAYNGASPRDIDYLMNYTHTIANTEAIGNYVTKNYNRAAFDSVVSKFDELPQELHERVWKNIDNVMDWAGVFDRNGDAILYDPITESYLPNRITIGCPTFLKLMQEADDKINFRAGILEEDYSRTNGQPQKGAESAKGQRVAEMELMAYAAYGASHYIDEALNEKSDNHGRMVNNHCSQLGIGPVLAESSCESRAVTNLLYLLEAAGVKLEVPKEIADTSHRNASLFKKTFNLPKYLNQLHKEAKEGIIVEEDWEDF